MTVFQMPFYFAHENKRITPDFEPIPGWKPFANYGSSPAQIIAHCVRNKDFSVLHAGDYFDETVNGTTYRWTIAEFNHYGRGEALLVPDKLIPDNTRFSDVDNLYIDSTLDWNLKDFYRVMPDSLKSYVLEMSLPWVDTNGEVNYFDEHVFPPSEIEAFGTAKYSNESSRVYTQWACFTDNSSRIRSNRWYWLRSTYSNRRTLIPVVNTDGSAAYAINSSAGGMLPCFCIG
ncbi:DUF6273 domain-containing protein [Gardnerella swidsinskii]|uniref:DUF6273 domain-containing protein n=1 Tax=Gardnerella swidsinskii TaxID=2792979 RepID=UPI0039FBCE20